ncbi:MAG TPA: terminase large subunit, partial [Candidatus Acidoferrum sp.]|nr:terminase large subunit [Candidatus Acidoferrum sp.]
MRRIDPRISEEVRWYLKNRGIPFPDCPPKVKTPEPVELDGAKFDPARVDHVLRVFSLLRHTQGEWAGRPLKPDPWQIAYFIAPVFGWVREDDRGELVRIIRRATMDVPRKNGKTTTAGGIAITLTTADNEPGAQVYALAAGKDQARFCFDPVKALAEQAPALKPHVRALANRIVHPRSASYFAVVASVADLMHGANVHGAIVDELHVHKKPDLLHAVESGTGSRRQPLIVTITTADDGRPETIYAKRRERLEDLAAGVLVDPAVYGVIWAADEDDDPFVESTWKKSNPGYGISPTRTFMEEAATEAKQSPSDQAKFLRLHLGIRTTMQTKYLSAEDWKACQSLLEPELLREREVFGGLDLSSTTDLAAVSLCFPEDDGARFLWHFWAPREGVEERERRDRVDYRLWAKQGFLSLTEEDRVINYDVIRRDL